MSLKSALFVSTLCLFTGTVSQASELIRIYIGSGPSLNTSLNPKIRFLNAPGDAGLLGMSSDILLSPGQHERSLVIRERPYLKPALSAFLAAETADQVLTGAGMLYGLLPEDADHLASALIQQAGPESLIIDTFKDCESIMKYLKNDSVTVYPPAALDVIQHFICN